MSKLIDRTGMRFGRLIVLSLDARRAKDGQARWICLCECGETTVVMGGNLAQGDVRSCGCLSRERSSRDNRTHGKSRTKVYYAWSGMLDRCYNQNVGSYIHYGGRGIKVCDRWRDSFKNFYEDMGDPPRGMSLDRIDNDGDYTPDNCKWSTAKEQNNNRRNNVKVEFNGEELTLKQLAEKMGVSYKTLTTRLYRGWPLEKAVNTPA